MGKMTEVQYDMLCDAATNLFNRFNPCKIKGGECEATRTFGAREKNNLCCAGCKHHSKERGCTTKSLACKLWVCDHIVNTNPQFYQHLMVLYRIAADSGFINTARESKEDYFKWQKRCEEAHEILSKMMPEAEAVTFVSKAKVNLDIEPFRAYPEEEPKVIGNSLEENAVFAGEGR